MHEDFSLCGAVSAVFARSPAKVAPAESYFAADHGSNAPEVVNRAPVPVKQSYGKLYLINFYYLRKECDIARRMGG